MSLLLVILCCSAVLALAYVVYGGLLARLLKLDPRAEMPSETMRDDLDYVPTEPQFLIGQHFSAIAAAGPVVGPIAAGLMFGWLPALLWIVVGSIFIGGVHDFTSIVASVRHKARSISEVVREHMTRRSYILFLVFIWIALVYIVVAFADITAASFVGRQTLENGDVVRGGGIATSSMLYLILPLIMGLLLRFTKLSVGWATAIFLPLVGVSIWAGQLIPLDLAVALNISDGDARKVWDVLLLAYCFVASIIPVWLLLQPRGYLGGVFLYVMLAAGAVGILFGGRTIEYPAFTGWQTEKGVTLFPILFITIACGACSGFHSLVASGTTSKQLRRETDAKPIGYGAMLLEALVALVSLSCVMMLAKGTPLLSKEPNFIYAAGIGSFMQILHIPAQFAVAFGLMAFSTFVYDTLDVCSRLGRYIMEELTGWRTGAGRIMATLLTAGTPLFFLLAPSATDAAGKAIPVWRVFWPIFGASNQLLAALALLGVTVWLARTVNARWVWAVTGLPTLFMYVMSVWALTQIMAQSYRAHHGFSGDPVFWVSLLLMVLAALMLLEAVRVLAGPKGNAVPSEREPVAVATA